MQVMCELARGRIVSIQTAKVCADPDISIGIFDEAGDPSVSEAVWVFGVRFIDFEAVSVVAVETVFGADP